MSLDGTGLAERHLTHIPRLASPACAGTILPNASGLE